MLPLLTTSERRSWKRCQQRWWWAYREGLRTRDMSPKLWFGIGIHLALARWYGSGQKRHADWVDLFQDYCDTDPMSKLLRERNSEGEKIWVDSRELGVMMLMGHRQRWGRDRQWDVVYTEEPMSIRIPHPDRPNRTVGIMNTTFDGVVWDRSERKLLLLEHKTAAAIQTQFLELDEQAGAMWALASQVLRDKGVLGARERIHGIQYNFLRKAIPPTDRPRNRQGLYLNQDGRVSKSQPAPFFVRPEPTLRTRIERSTQVRRIGDELLEMRRFRTGERRLGKNPTRDCFWDCDFFTLCKLHEQGAEWKQFRDFMFTIQDPYANYRKSTEE